MAIYDHQCGSCIYYCINDLAAAARDGYGCKASGRIFGSPNYKRFPFDHTCGSYKKDRTRSDNDILTAFKRLDYKYGYRPGSSSWWHIATFVNETLGKDSCEEYFSIMASFRENILQSSLKYISFLTQYDTYGRLIADSLYKDPQKIIIAQELLSSHIIPICQDIIAQNFDSAFGKYVSMFETLKNLYQINDIKTYNFENPQTLSDDDIAKLCREKKEQN